MGKYLSGEWSVLELGLQIDHNIVNRDAWSILKDQDEDVKSGVLTTLHRYAIIWIPEDAPKEDEDDADDSELEDGEFEKLPLNTGRIIELYMMAESDFEKGLKFVREVEKGSHLKPNTIPKFRPDALKVLCEVTQIALEKLDLEPEEDEDEDDDDDDFWDDEDGEDEENDAEEGDDKPVLSGDEAEQSSDEVNTSVTKLKRGEKLTNEQVLQMEADESAKEQQQLKDLIGKVYETSKEQLKARIQLQVHQYRLKEKKARK